MTKRSKSLSPQLVITVTKQNPPLTPATFAFKPTEKDSVAPPRLDEDKNSDGGDRELTNLVGKQLPDLTVNDGSLQKIKLTELINKPTLITLWATWCEPCLKEMPFFQKLVDKYDGKFQVLAIATSEEKILTAVQFAKKHPEYKFTFLLDPDAEREVSALKKSLGGVEALPTNLLINANGKIISARQGERKESEWTELIDKLITN